MANISMEGVVNPYRGCYNSIVNNNSGGVNSDVSEFINNFDKLDSDTIDVDVKNGIDVKISQKEDNILKKTETGLYAGLEWEEAD